MNPESGSLDFDAFCAVVAVAVDRPVAEVRSCGRLVDGLALDELSLAMLLLAVEGLNPHFAIPEQVEVGELTLADLHHFACVMTEGHMEREAATP